MDVAVAESFVQAAQPFVDGFGERRVVVDARGERLDVLRLNSTLSAVPSFEAALRERVGRVAGFRHESYSRVRTVEIDRPTSTLLVISDHIRGARLSILLACAEKRAVPAEIPAIGCVIRQLVHAAAAWREQMPDAVHGAISPDRIMITPEGKRSSSSTSSVRHSSNFATRGNGTGRVGRTAPGHVQRRDQRSRRHSSDRCRRIVSGTRAPADRR